MAILSQVESSISVAQVARENGVPSALGFRWKKEIMGEPEKVFAGSGRPNREQARVAELKFCVLRSRPFYQTARMRAPLFHALQLSSQEYNEEAWNKNTSLILGLVHSLGVAEECPVRNVERGIARVET